MFTYKLVGGPFDGTTQQIHKHTTMVSYLEVPTIKKNGGYKLTTMYGPIHRYKKSIVEGLVVYKYQED